MMNAMFIGNFRAAFAGKGIEFRDFREYEYGDDAKYIDWVTSSREQHTVMRRYQEEKDADIFVVVDVSEGLFFQNHIKENLLSELLDFIYMAVSLSGESL